MWSPDLINASLELGGALFSALNVVRLWRDRTVAGVSYTAFAFFTLWGCWNLFYYPHLSQPLSALAALALVLVNIAWLLLAWWFARERRRIDRLITMPIVTRRST